MKKIIQLLLVLFVFSITFLNIYAQILDSALVIDSTKILSETGLNEDDKPPVRYENGIKIVGEKTFDIKVEGTGIKEIIYTNVDGIGNCAYIISDDKIGRLKPNSFMDSVNVGILKPEDGSKIFTHDGAIYVSPDGTLFATTTTMIMIMKIITEIQRKYADRFEGFPLLIHPTIREGNGSNVVDIRDDAIDGSKIQVSKDCEMTAKKDE